MWHHFSMNIARISLVWQSHLNVGIYFNWILHFDMLDLISGWQLHLNVCIYFNWILHLDTQFCVSYAIFKVRWQGRRKGVCRVGSSTTTPPRGSFQGDFPRGLSLGNHWLSIPMWKEGLYVQNWLELSSGILHCYHLTSGSMLTSQDYSRSSVVYVPEPIRAI